MLQLRRKRGVPTPADASAIGQPVVNLQTGELYIKTDDSSMINVCAVEAQNRQSAINNLNVDSVGSDGCYIKTIYELSGKVYASTQLFDVEIDDNATDDNTPTSKAVVDYVKSETKRTLSVSLATLIDSVVTPLTDVTITILDDNDNQIAVGTSSNAPINFSLPLNLIYKVVCPSPITLDSVVCFYPHAINMLGTLSDNVTVSVTYDNTSSITTIQSVKEFLALDSITLELKREALVSNENNSFTFDCELTDPDTNTSYTMPFRVLDVSDNMIKKVDGEDVTFTGALIQSAYTLVSKVCDEREQEKATGLFEDNLYYYYGTNKVLGDQSFTALTKGEDYQVGDSIQTWEDTNEGKYVFKHSFAPGSGNTSTMNLMRYGSNIIEDSNLYKWLNGSGLDWFSSSHVGDVLATSYVNKHGFKDWWKSEDLACIEDNVAYGVYNRSGYELPNNKIYCQFTLPSGTELAGSVNSYEGSVTDYWLWKNGGVVKNDANSNRVMLSVTAKTSNQYVWTRSPYRSYSNYVWLLITSGFLYDYGYAYLSYGVSPLFTI